MNNATYFDGCNGRLTLVDAFAKWCSFKNTTANVLAAKVVLDFAKAPAMEVLQFDIGQVVQFDFDNMKNLYGTVLYHHQNALALDNGQDATAPRILYVRAQNGTTYAIQNCGTSLRMPEFPQGLVELVRNQLQANCPLKEAACR